MGSIFNPPSPPALPPVQPLPKPPTAAPKPKSSPAAPDKLSPEQESKIQKEQAAIERKRKGRKSTILTGPLGIQESEETKLKTLLGE
jgi:hypothetical protein